MHTNSINISHRLVRSLGALFLIIMLLSIVGNMTIVNLAKQDVLIISIFNNPGLITLATSFLVLNSIGVIFIGLFAYPILKLKSQLYAVGYLVSRSLEAVLLLIGVIAFLVLIPLSQTIVGAVVGVEATAEIGNVSKTTLEMASLIALKWNWYAYNSAMIVLGFSGVFFCYFFYSEKLIPKALSLLGIIGYTILGATSLLAIAGIKLGLYITIPVFFFEVGLGIWLIIKGLSIEHFKKS